MVRAHLFIRNERKLTHAERQKFENKKRIPEQAGRLRAGLQQKVLADKRAKAEKIQKQKTEKAARKQQMA